MSYVIEEGIPIPHCNTVADNNGRKRGPISPWKVTLDALQPGQSTFTEDMKDVQAATAFRVQRPEKAFVVRKIPGQGWRVWRTE